MLSFLLGMITVIILTLTTFIETQQTLIKFDRKEQVAELILQGNGVYKQNATYMALSKWRANYERYL